MVDIDLVQWPIVASSGARSTMIEGGKYRDQKMVIRRHTDGRGMVVGSVIEGDEIVAEKHEIFTGDGLKPAMRNVALALRLDSYIFETCLKDFLR